MSSISPIIARRLVIAAQGLDKSAVFPSGADALDHLGYVQIDTISVVERAHHHVFWSRVGAAYRKTDLHRYQESERRVFEYWSHAAAYLPIADYRFALPRMQLFRSGKRHWFTPTPDHARWRRRILARISEEGALGVRDFTVEGEGGKSGWFEWRPAKQALEQLFMEGRVLVAGRRGFAKVFDLPERVLPPGLDVSFPSPAEHARHLIQRALRAQGLARHDEIAYLRRKPVKDQVARECRRGLKEGWLHEVQVAGAERPFLALREGWDSLRERAEIFSGAVKVLSPFDNFVIQRDRLRELFGFDYTIECYVPAPKRKFGYFCLPVLAGDALVGRIDAKAERAEGVLRVKAFHVEPGVGRPKGVWERIEAGLRDFANFNGCAEIRRDFTFRPRAR